MGSGEHALELPDTDRCPPPSDPEPALETWPPAPAAPRLDLTTTILDEELEP